MHQHYCPNNPIVPSVIGLEMAGISKSCLCFILLIFISHVMVSARNVPTFPRPIREPDLYKPCHPLSSCALRPGPITTRPADPRRCSSRSSCIRGPPYDMAKKGNADDTIEKKNAVKTEGRGGYNKENP